MIAVNVISTGPQGIEINIRNAANEICNDFLDDSFPEEYRN